jgi:uncharacterized protein
LARDETLSLIHASISEDKLRAFIALDPGIPPDELNLTLLLAALAERGVMPSFISNDTLTALIANYAPDAPTPSTVVAEGKAPQHGRDAILELTPAFAGSSTPAPAQPSAASPAPTADTAVDHYARAGLTIARQGDSVARLIPATEGIDGIDVLGRTLAAKSGRQLPIAIGDGLELSPQGLVTALFGGLFERDDSRIRLVRTLRIPGFVDFSTGHVDFPGDILIDRGVRDCFQVRAAGDLSIRELVEAASLDAGKDITLETGMAAREKGSLFAARDLTANYISNARVFVGRHARIHRELANCSTQINGRLSAPSCGIVGGSLHIAGACEVGHLGGESAARTEITIGKLPHVEKQLAALLALIPQLDARLAKAQQRLSSLQSATAKLTPAQAEELTELEFGLAEERRRRANVSRALSNALTRVNSWTRAALTVHTEIHPGVRLWIGRYAADFRKPVKGPLRIDLDAQGTPTLTLTSSGESQPLAKSARVTEESKYLDLKTLTQEHVAA